MSELRAAAEQPQPDLAERLERIARALPNVADCDAPQVELREIAMCLRSLPVEQPVAWLLFFVLPSLAAWLVWALLR